jgi:hypothetical protein
VRVIARRADAVTDFGDARLWSETTRLDLRVAEVPNRQQAPTAASARTADPARSPNTSQSAAPRAWPVSMAMLGRVQLPDWKVWVLGVVPVVTGWPKAAFSQNPKASTSIGTPPRHRP